MDDAIAQVAAITGSTPELAAQYVQLADGDANQAVQLFFENGGADLAGQSSAAQTSASTSRPSGRVHDPISVDDDDQIPDDDHPQTTGSRMGQGNFEDDEAMARRLQEEMYGNGGGDEGGGIRAPIARQAETLLGPGADAGYLQGADLDAAVQQRMQELQQRRARGAQRGIFSQRETSDIWQEQSYGRPSLAEATGGASEASARSNMLARLFQPPWDLMYKGSWDDARDEGKEFKKWILVNIQDGSIFDCQALNRDLWKNDSVVDTVKENFVFLQYSKDDPRADSYIQFYFPQHDNPDMFPHIAIVDPRTGEQTKLWSRKIPSPADFLMQLHEFLDRYSLDNNARNPVAKRKSEAKKEKTIDQMTEDEMLEKALHDSMAAQAGNKVLSPDNEDPDDLTRSIGDLRKAEAKDADAMSIYENGSSSAQVTPFGQIPSDQPHEEPPQGPGITRIQIRHPGGRIVRRFAQEDPVQRIYEYLKADPLEGKEEAEFELVSMGKNLMESRDQTIDAAGLKNGTVMVEFVDNS